MSFEDFKAAMRQYHAEEERKKRRAEEKQRLTENRAEPKTVPPSERLAHHPSVHSAEPDIHEDYIGSVCLLHKLTPKTPAYEEILIDVEDFEWASQFGWRIDRVNSRAKCKYVVRKDGKFLAILLMKPPAGMKVDHIYHQPLDNRRERLRVITHRENNINSRRQKNGSSQYKGVFRAGLKWHVRAGARGRRVFIGSFDDEIEAARAYNQFAREQYGEFAYQNPV